MSSNAIVTLLSAEEIKSRVQSTNSFSKLEMAAHGGLIALERKAKRETLSTFTGSNVGTVIDSLREKHGAVVNEMKSSVTATKQKWTITLTAKRTTTEVQRLAEKAARLQKQVDKVNADIAKANAQKNVTPEAPKAPEAPATTKA